MTLFTINNIRSVFGNNIDYLIVNQFKYGSELINK